MWSEHFGIPARLEMVAVARNRVIDILGPLGLSDAVLFDLKVAAGEALANAVRHGSPAGERDEISIRVTVYEDRIDLEVTDSGVGFDGDHSAIVPDADGRGILLMRALVDDVTYAPGMTGGALVTLSKRLTT